MREKLIELLGHVQYLGGLEEKIADHLIANGVTIQRRGRWKLHKDGSGTCDQCGGTEKNVWDYDSWQHFCGRCGAKMDGEQSEA